MHIDSCRAPQTVRAAIVSDRCLRRRALERLLRGLPPVRLAACHCRLHEALRCAAGGHIDALLIDELLLCDRALALLRRSRNGARVRMLAYTPDSLADPALFHDLPLDGVIHPAMDEAAVLHALRGTNGHAAPPPLSGRQRAVADMTLAGLPLKAMAAHMSCAINTAQTHRRRAMEKLGARTLPDFVMRWHALAGPVAARAG